MSGFGPNWFEEIAKSFSAEKKEKPSDGKSVEQWQNIPKALVDAHAEMGIVDDIEKGGEMDMVSAATAAGSLALLFGLPPSGVMRALIIAGYLAGREVGAKHGAATAEGRK